MDEELDIDALDELLGQELVESEDQDPPYTESNQIFPSQKNEDGPSCAASKADIEKQLCEMQEKMDLLRRQLENQKSARQEAPPQSSSPATRNVPRSKRNYNESSSEKAVATRAPIKLMDADIFSAKDDCKLQEKAPLEKSVVHSGDTDSSDDEKRYPTESSLSKFGKSVKKNLEDRLKPSEFSSRRRVDTWKDKPKGTLPLGEHDGSGVRDPYSGIRIIRPVVSSTVMEARMTGRKMVKMSMVPSFVKQKNIDIDWVTIGVLVNKSPPKTSKNVCETS